MDFQVEGVVEKKIYHFFMLIEIQWFHSRRTIDRHDDCTACPVFELGNTMSNDGGLLYTSRFPCSKNMFEATLLFESFSVHP